MLRNISWLVLPLSFPLLGQTAELELGAEEKQWLKRHPVITIGVDPEWPPFEYLDSQGQHKGIAAEYLEIVGERLGITFKVSPDLSWPEVIEKAKNKQIDLLPAVRVSSQRQQYLNFTEPYVDFPMVIITRQGSQLSGDLTGLEGKKVSVVNSYVTHELLDRNHPGIHLHPKGNIDQALQALSTGEVEAYIGNLASISFAIDRLGLTNLKVVAATSYSFPLSLAVRKDWPELLPILQKALNSISVDESRPIREKWIQTQLESGYDIKSILPVALPILAIVFTFIVVSVYKNRRLQREISERVKSENKYRRLFDCANDAIIIISDDLFLDCNNKALSVFGCSKEEIIGKSFQKFLPYRQTDGSLSVKEYKKRISLTIEGSPQRFEWRYKRFDGEQIESDVSFNTIEVNNKLCLQGIIRDITQQKYVERALSTIIKSTSPFTGSDYFQELVKRLAVTLDVKYAIVGELVDADKQTIRVIAEWNGANITDSFTYELEGTPCEAVVGRAACVYKDNVQELFSSDQMLVDMGIRSYAGAPLFDSKKNPLGVLAVMDVKPIKTELIIESVISNFSVRAGAELDRVRIEDKLRQAAVVFENSDEGFMVTDGDFNIVAINRAYTDITGYTEMEVLGRVPSVLQMGNNNQQFNTNFWQSIMETGEWQGQMQSHRKNGEQYIEWVKISILKDSDDNIINYVGVFSDITKQVQAEERQNDLQVQLIHTQKMESLGQLTGGIAHDFNNILSSILGYTYLAQCLPGSSNDKELTGYLDEVKAAGERARNLIAQLLTFSRGLGKGDKHPLILNNVMEEAVNMLHPMLPASIDLSYHADVGIPPIDADPGQMHQLILNLCINARDAMEDKGRIEVVLSMASELDTVCHSCGKSFSGKYAQLSVRDTGPGICPDVQKHLFEPFFSTKEFGKGTGMGLAMVHGITHEHYGHIVVNSIPGKGAEFRSLFPIRENNMNIDLERAQVKVELMNGSCQKILIVDDEKPIAIYLKTLLEKYNYSANIFTDSEKALQCFQENPHRFDLIITDQTMPGKTGDVIARSMLEVRPELPIILCTGYNKKIDNEFANSVGIKAFMSKPFDSEEVIKTVNNLLTIH